jgi:GntR family transcriptional regulator
MVRGSPPADQAGPAVVGFVDSHGRARRLASKLSVSPGTVARAYRELAIDELVTGRGRHGTVVVDEPPGSEPMLERANRLAAAASAFALAVRQLGIRKATAIEAAQHALDDIEKRET